MGPFVWLLFLSFSMLAGSFLAGNLPLLVHLTDDHLNLISTFGSGLLVGTALIVIIPEGVETLYAVQGVRQVVADPDSYPQAEQHSVHPDEPSSGAHSHNPASHSETNRGSLEKKASPLVSRGSDEGATRSGLFDSQNPGKSESDDSHTDHQHSQEGFAAHRYIGPALSVGFAFMFLIDHFGSAHDHHHTSHISVSEFPLPRAVDVLPAERSKTAATVGLVVHAAADGIALGAASSSSRTSLELIVFVAIMLHKAPSAFGLSTFLLHEGRSKRVVRQHLLVFSLAAPLAAIITYIFLKQGFYNAAAMQKWTGTLLLFSAGTFLYVATVHILPEIYANHSKGSNPGTSPVTGTTGHVHAKNLSILQIIAFLCGVFAPIILTIEHTH
ncbi:zinc transporter ZIP9-A-like protein [Polychytrium aggregatum]|uniref:zinc transporter ZIP9-A-like protein n=1 Tax=Polychytrium aggregatum TaxID=110093 RepID=UPI0022FEAE58|nr:zinc transporter ZIP9-A-like protein [Polychytrium aggregatum]KAI9208173.1 zinc transporter ZIP9-A-like protein [Polychytrium aggregatum]